MLRFCFVAIAFGSVSANWKNKLHSNHDKHMPHRGKAKSLADGAPSDIDEVIGKKNNGNILTTVDMKAIESLRLSPLQSKHFTNMMNAKIKKVKDLREMTKRIADQKDKIIKNLQQHLNTLQEILMATKSHEDPTDVEGVTYGIGCQSTDPCEVDVNGVLSCPRATGQETALRLNNLGIKSIADGTFEAMPNLVYLNLAHNELPFLRSDNGNNVFEPAFQALTNLQHLRVEYNQITYLASNDLVLPELKMLDLSRNKITKLDVSHFEYCSKLVRLDLNYNEISTLETITDTSGGTRTPFSSLANLRILSLANNLLSSIPPQIFSACSPNYLSLSSNKLTSITSGTFDSLVSNKYLGLARNELTSLEDNTFDFMSTTKHLDLSYNQFTEESSIPSGIFRYMGNLRRLIFKGNGFSDDIPSFIGLGMLMTLDLSHNELVTIPENAFWFLDSITNLYLDNNPNLVFSSDCLDKISVTIRNLYLDPTTPTNLQFCVDASLHEYPTDTETLYCSDPIGDSGVDHCIGIPNEVVSLINKKPRFLLQEEVDQDMDALTFS